MNAATGAPVGGPPAELLEWLTSHKVEFEVHEHPVSYTARETARASGVDPRIFIKTIGVVAGDGRRALLALDANDQLDLMKARRLLDTPTVRLLTESELIDACPGCEVGAMPPIGPLFGVPTFADFAVREDREVVFHGGNHHVTIRVDREAWAREAGVAYGDLADRHLREPAWARS